MNPLKTETDRPAALLAALTPDQIKKVLTMTFELLEPAQVGLLLETLEPDISLTLKRLLKPDDISPTEARIISDDKLFADWRDLWSQWADVTFDVGDEDGTYVQQEAHWEPPYFDPYALADDLEKIATKMRDMLEDVCALDREDDDCFAAEFGAIDDSIDRFPEWMGADAEPCMFEHETTDCFLTWEWLMTRKQQQSTTDFLERLLAIEDEWNNCRLDQSAYYDFFTETLPPACQQEIFDYINANKEAKRWQKALNQARSRWNHIYSHYATLFDADAHLDLCRLNLAQDWQCGPPLIQDMLKKGNLQEVDKLYEQTLVSYARFHNRQRDDWQPEKNLLWSPAFYGNGDPSPAIIDLLAGWIDIAEKLKQNERKVALEFQKLLFSTPHAWDDIAEFYRRYRDIPAVAILTEQWRTLMYDRCLPRDIFGNNKDDRDTWVNWLLQAGLEDDPENFTVQMSTWLEQLKTARTAFTNQQQAISLLTSDLAALAPDRAPCPRLLSMIDQGGYRQTDLAINRQKWLKKFGGEPFVDPLLNCWREHVAHLVPDPVNHNKSDYTPHARWLAVVHELNATMCQSIIANWQVEHHRRKNLWKALKVAGIIG